MTLLNRKRLGRSILHVLVLSIVVASGARADRGSDGDKTRLISELQRLSFDLREIPIDLEVRAAALRRLEHDGLDATYAYYVDQWLGRRYQLDVLNSWSPFGNGVPTLFLRLAFFDSGGRKVLYLPGRHQDLNPPCQADQIISVRPWWAETPVSLCKDSHRKDTSFVGGIYCANAPESLAGPGGAPQGCGCGPRLVHCLPPAQLEPAINAATAGITAEYTETAYDIVIRQARPVADLLSTTRTWQNGLVTFLYARREIAGLVGTKALTPSIEQQIDRILARVNVLAKGSWVDRQGAYRGTGTNFTLAGIKHSSYRNMVRQTYSRLLCSTFRSSHVDRDAVLATVGNDAENIRGFDPIADSPMRQQEGCKGCHMPMDTTSGFMFEQQLSWRGGFMTPVHRKPAKMYIHGAEDYRGDGVGIAGFMKLLVAQPEYLDCTIEKTFEHVVQRAPVSSERRFIEELTKTFKQRKQDQVWLIRELLLSAAYRE
jgi:hypothetical protein